MFWSILRDRNAAQKQFLRSFWSRFGWFLVPVTSAHDRRLWRCSFPHKSKLSCFLLCFRLAKWTEWNEYLILHSYAALRCITWDCLWDPEWLFFNVYFLCMPTGQWSKLEQLTWCRRKHQINLLNWLWVGNVLSKLKHVYCTHGLKKMGFWVPFGFNLHILTSQDSSELPRFGVYRNKWLNNNLSRS